ncbi:hypothetical protein [Nocardia sp. NBC_00416]|uniref:hypothetical protein n=1 Tax=Nocardia sp. NBC_00416 TaxID=2975991 RepID=UPI002E227EF6
MPTANVTGATAEVRGGGAEKDEWAAHDKWGRAAREGERAAHDDDEVEQPAKTSEQPTTMGGAARESMRVAHDDDEVEQPAKTREQPTTMGSSYPGRRAGSPRRR